MWNNDGPFTTVGEVSFESWAEKKRKTEWEVFILGIRIGKGQSQGKFLRVQLLYQAFS